MYYEVQLIFIPAIKTKLVFLLLLFFTSITPCSFIGNTQRDSWNLPMLITLGCVRGKIKMIRFKGAEVMRMQRENHLE